MATQAQIEQFNQAISSGNFAAAGAIAQAAGVSPEAVTGYLNEVGSSLGLTGPVTQDVVSSYMGGAGPVMDPGATVLPIAPTVARPLAPTGDLSSQLIAAYNSGNIAEINRLVQAQNLNTRDVRGMFPDFDINNMLAGINLPRGTTATSTDPLGSREQYLNEVLGRARELFLTGDQPTAFPGRTFVPPSAETLQSLEQQTTLAGSMAPMLEQARQAYMSSLGSLQDTARGDFLQGSPFRDAMVTAATRPLTQQFSEQVLPGISSQFSAAGRFGSGAMERAQGRATEGFGRALGDVTAGIVAQDYGRERQFQEAAMRDVGTLAGRAPQFFAASFLPATALSQVGAQREAILGQPLQEEMARFQFEQQLPFDQLQRYAATVQGVPMPAAAQPQGNRTLQNVGAALNIASAVPGAVAGVRSAGNFISGLLN
jgi:hypothetical protein